MPTKSHQSTEDQYEDEQEMNVEDQIESLE